jgi:hypothetical protein
VYQEEMHDSDLDIWFIFNLHREYFFYFLHTNNHEQMDPYLILKKMAPEQPPGWPLKFVVLARRRNSLCFANAV